MPHVFVPPPVWNTEACLRTLDRAAPTGNTLPIACPVAIGDKTDRILWKRVAVKPSCVMADHRQDRLYHGLHRFHGWMTGMVE